MGEEILESSIEKETEKILNYLQKKGWIKNAKEMLDLFKTSNDKSKSTLNCIKDCTSPVKFEENDKRREIAEKIGIIFNAFKIGKKGDIIKPEDVNVLIIGQDPYPDANKADGFAFLQNKFSKEDSLYYILNAINESRIENFNINYNNLSKEEGREKHKIWAEKNKVLLLNAALTFQKYYHSHKKPYSKAIKNLIKNEQNKLKTKNQKAWYLFIKHIILSLLTKSKNKLVVFLWGDDSKNTFLECINNTALDMKREIKI